MMTFHRLTCLVPLLMTGACTRPVDTDHETQTLLAADSAWQAVASAGEDADSVLSFWTDDARVVMPGQVTLQGKDAIRQMITGSFATPGFRVTWVPERAVVSASGDLGYTVGTNAFTVPDSAGVPATMAGRYIAVWRKGTDGRWRCVEDYGTPAAVAAAPSQ